MEQRAWVATRKGLFELQRRSGAWAIARSSFLGEPVSMMLPPTGSGRMFAALNLGHFGVKLHASDDRGETWTEVATPTYPPQPEGAAGPAWKLVQIWALEAAGDSVWAGTLPGGLFRSSDGGASWQLVESLWNQPGRAEWFGGGYDVPGIHSICPHPTRAGEALLGISCGGAWLTQDDGASWALRARGMSADYMPPEKTDDQNVQDPHRIVRCRAQPEVLWCQHHNGIWRTVDNGASVDGALAVNRTRDGGRSFETLRAGLPQSDCYDLIYRHGLAVSDDGHRLLVGSTTGGLWASDDGGDRWHTVSAHLPPIHAVRFG